MKQILETVRRVELALKALRAGETSKLTKDEFIDCIALDVNCLERRVEQALERLERLENNSRWVAGTCNMLANLTNQILEEGPYTYTEKVFCIDDVIVNVKGVSNKQYWNGWEMPFFTYDEVVNRLKPQIESQGTSIEYDKEKDSFIVHYSDEDEAEDEVYEAKIINGKKHYGIGAASWTWTIQEEEASPYASK